jgi:hypothetical protein
LFSEESYRRKFGVDFLNLSIRQSQQFLGQWRIYESVELSQNVIFLLVDSLECLGHFSVIPQPITKAYRVDKKNALHLKQGICGH